MGFGDQTAPRAHDVIHEVHHEKRVVVSASDSTVVHAKVRVYIAIGPKFSFQIFDNSVLIYWPPVLVQSEMEKNIFPLVKIPPLRGGDFQGMRIHRPMPVSRSFALAR